MKSLAVLIFEDNSLLRESISSLIASRNDMTILGAFENVLTVKDQVSKYNPDLILMDIDMPGRSGIEAVKEIRQSNIQTPIIMLTVFDDNTNVLDAIRAGASGYLLKKHLSTKLYDSIDEVLAGGAPMSPSVARMVIASMHQKPQLENAYQLTP